MQYIILKISFFGYICDNDAQKLPNTSFTVNECVNMMDYNNEKSWAIKLIVT